MSIQLTDEDLSIEEDNEEQEEQEEELVDDEDEQEEENNNNNNNEEEEENNEEEEFEEINNDSDEEAEIMVVRPSSLRFVDVPDLDEDEEDGNKEEDEEKKAKKKARRSIAIPVSDFSDDEDDEEWIQEEENVFKKKKAPKKQTRSKAERTKMRREQLRRIAIAGGVELVMLELINIKSLNAAKTKKKKGRSKYFVTAVISWPLYVARKYRTEAISATISDDGELNVDLEDTEFPEMAVYQRVQINDPFIRYPKILFVVKQKSKFGPLTTNTTTLSKGELRLGNIIKPQSGVPHKLEDRIEVPLLRHGKVQGKLVLLVDWHPVKKRSETNMRNEIHGKAGGAV